VRGGEPAPSGGGRNSRYRYTLSARAGSSARRAKSLKRGASHLVGETCQLFQFTKSEAQSNEECLQPAPEGLSWWSVSTVYTPHDVDHQTAKDEPLSCGLDVIAAEVSRLCVRSSTAGRWPVVPVMLAA
jgi:hypothetical protein